MNKWCEHCRAHFLIDHYSENGQQHLAGTEYGPYGELLDKANSYDEIITIANEDSLASDGLEMIYSAMREKIERTN